MYSRLRKAFSMIELLVVVAVVAVLAAIVHPLAYRARQRAMQTRCLDNLREISIAAMAYTADHDETYPPARFPSDGPNSTRDWTWKRSILPYLQYPKVFRCPQVRNPWAPCPGAPGAFGDPSNGRMEFRDDPSRTLWLPASYAYSGGFFSALGRARARRTAEARNPSELLYIVSSRLGGAELGPDALEREGVNPETGTPDRRFWNRFGPFPAHLGRIPFVMADGRVQSLGVIDTVSPRDRWRSQDPAWDTGTEAGRRRLLSAAARMQSDISEYH